MLGRFRHAAGRREANHHGQLFVSRLNDRTRDPFRFSVPRPRIVRSLGQWLGPRCATCMQRGGQKYWPRSKAVYLIELLLNMVRLWDHRCPLSVCGSVSKCVCCLQAVSVYDWLQAIACLLSPAGSLSALGYC